VRVASVPERPAEIIVREDAQPEVADRFGDGARAVRRVDSPSVLAKEGVEVRLVLARLQKRVILMVAREFDVAAGECTDRRRGSRGTW